MPLIYSSLVDTYSRRLARGSSIPHTTVYKADQTWSWLEDAHRRREIAVMKRRLC